MSASTVIGEVTKTLKELLEKEQRPPDTFKVSLTSPAEENSDSQTMINLFLFRIDENAYAKNQEWKPIGTDILHYPPLSLNLFYVITPYASEPLTSQQILGEAMRILYDHAIITEPFLKDSLDELKVDLCPFNLEELTRIWNAFNKPYRLSVCYQVRIVYIDSGIKRDIRRVKEKEIQFVEN